MSKGGGSAKAPKPMDQAKAQEYLNETTAKYLQHLNAVNQVSPTGDLNFTWDPNTGQMTQTQSLTDPQSQLLHQGEQIGSGVNLAALGMMPGVNSAISQPLNFGGTTPLPTDFSADRQHVEDALYKRATAHLDPQWQTAQRQFDSKMAAQGIPTNSEAFRTAQSDFERSKSDAYTNAREIAAGAANAQQQAMFQEALAGRQQGIQEILQQRQEPINELNALLARGGGVGSPQGGAPSGSAPQVGTSAPDIMGAFQSQQAAANARAQQQSQQQASETGAAASLASAAIMAAAMW